MKLISLLLLIAVVSEEAEKDDDRLFKSVSYSSYQPLHKSVSAAKIVPVAWLLPVSRSLVINFGNLHYSRVNIIG